MAKQVASVPRLQFYAAGRVANPASRANEAAVEASVSFAQLNLSPGRNSVQRRGPGTTDLDRISRPI